MSNHVTDEMVETAARAMDHAYNPDRAPILAAMFRDYALAALEAAAPLIAAAALRDAADWLDDMARGYRESAYLSAGRALTSRLRARADQVELEADRGGQSWETGAMSDYAKEDK